MSELPAWVGAFLSRRVEVEAVLAAVSAGKRGPIEAAEAKALAIKLAVPEVDGLLPPSVAWPIDKTRAEAMVAPIDIWSFDKAKLIEAIAASLSRSRLETRAAAVALLEVQLIKEASGDGWSAIRDAIEDMKRLGVGPENRA